MKRKLLILLSLIIGLYLYMGFREPEKREIKPVLKGNQFRIAHRCGREIYPENTLFACKKVLEEGLADFLEFDFHLTKDKIPVVIHDFDLSRTTNGQGKIAEKNWDEIKDLDAGYNFTKDGGQTYPYRGKGIRLETLERFFQELKTAKLMIEVKPNSLIANDILLELIQKYKMEDRVVTGSFHQNVKDDLRDKNPRLAFFASKSEVTKWIILNFLGLSHFYFIPSDSMALPPDMGITQLTQELIDRIHSQGLKVHVWTINDLEEMEKWKKMGVDGIMTDNPKLFENLDP